MKPQAVRPRTLIIPLLAVGALAVAGCGSSNPPGSQVARIGPATTTTRPSDTSGPPGSGIASQFEQTVRFTECLRAHGEPNVPDPTRNGDNINFNLNGVNRNSPQFQAAARACAKYAPPGIATGGSLAQLRVELDEFAACMRSHGLPTYPDPKFGSSSTGSGHQNKVSIEIGGTGINRNSPQYARALQACRSRLPGGGRS
jgi:hypothetical protein